VDFQEADRRYAEIKRHQETGGLTQEEFDKQLEALMVQDEEGRWWAKSRTTGDWHYHDGTTWVKGKPPGYQGNLTGPEVQPEIQQSESLEAEERTQRIATLYDQGQQHMKAEEWQQALECFEEVQRLEPNYRDTKALLEQTRQEVSADDADKAEAGEESREQMAGQSTDQAERAQPDYSTGTESRPPLSILGRNWWALALVGLINALHGLLDLLAGSPDAGVFFRLLASSLLIAIGVFTFIASSTADPRLLLRTQGMISGLAGLVASLGGAIAPSYASTLLETLQTHPFRIVHWSAFDFWGISIGVIQIIVAIRLQWDFKILRLMVVSGAFLAFYGIYGLFTLLRFAGASEGLLGILLLASGISLVVFTFWVRKLEEAEVEG
jgi:tetratricopeptide (TPR) repeat protein